MAQPNTTLPDNNNFQQLTNTVTTNEIYRCDWSQVQSHHFTSNYLLSGL